MIARSGGADNIFIHLDTYHMHVEEKSFEAGSRRRTTSLSCMTPSKQARVSMSGTDFSLVR
ncbi:hypothetical protein [Mesorhizobium sp. M1396]|uniref:hypothetical protein n=1 Tax=Mesorhizobium sp. M1396 TaxID=2957095 RepID=UPI003337BC6B